MSCNSNSFFKEGFQQNEETQININQTQINQPSKSKVAIFVIICLFILFFIYLNYNRLKNYIK